MQRIGAIAGLLALYPVHAFASGAEGFLLMVWAAYGLVAAAVVAISWYMTRDALPGRRTTIRTLILGLTCTVVPPVGVAEVFLPLPLFVFPVFFNPDVRQDLELMAAVAASLALTTALAWYGVTRMASTK